MWPPLWLISTMDVTPPPPDLFPPTDLSLSPPPVQCTATVVAKYLGLCGQISGPLLWQRIGHAVPFLSSCFRNNYTFSQCDGHLAQYVLIPPCHICGAYLCKLPRTGTRFWVQQKEKETGEKWITAEQWFVDQQNLSAVFTTNSLCWRQ